MTNICCWLLSAEEVPNIAWVGGQLSFPELFMFSTSIEDQPITLELGHPHFPGGSAFNL
jgi:hypothetical protein